MKKLLAVFFISAFLGSAAVAETVNLTFEWDANTESDLAGYRLYYSETNGGPYTPIEEVGLITTVSTPVVMNPGDTFYFVLTAFDTEANESGYSNQVSFFLSATGPGIPPRPPTLRLPSWELVTSKQ